MFDDLLKKIDGEKIYTFKKGDHVIRVRNAELKVPVSNTNLGVDAEITVGHCACHRKTPKEFMGVYNNLIYLRDIMPRRPKVRKRVYTVDLGSHEDGWALFELPENLQLRDCLWQ